MHNSLPSQVALSCSGPESVRIAGQNSDLIELRHEVQSMNYVSQTRCDATCQLGAFGASGLACLEWTSIDSMRVDRC